MPEPTSSPTLTLVLRHLRRTRPRILMRTAVRELMTHNVLVLRETPNGPGDGPGRLVLLRGPEAPPPSRSLQLVARAVEAVPPELVDGEDARDLTVVATQLTGRPDLGRSVRNAALQELETAGLITMTQRTWLGVIRWTRVERTEPGRGQLDQPGPRIPRRDSSDGVAVIGPVGADGSRPDDARLDDAGLHTAWPDGAHPDFDAAFDSGADGSGGGDGGDGGGGGGGD